MLAVEIELLTGRYVASEFNDRYQAEWPPHPARVFSALVAALHAGDSCDPVEREALEWLEGQGPPALVVPEAGRRGVTTSFVPVNDSADPFKMDGKKIKVHQPTASLPIGRNRQPRCFPSVTPLEPLIHFLWRDAEPTAVIRQALAALLSRVTRIGHSSSLVRCGVTDRPRGPDWIPAEEGPLVLRVPQPGQLEMLEDEFERHREETVRVLPCRFQRYARAGEAPTEGAIPESVFGDDWVVFRFVNGPRLPVTRGIDTAKALRGALEKYADQPPREVLTGHTPDGGHTAHPHVAFLPLPFVSHQQRHADGHLLGAAVVLPRTVNETDQLHVLRAVGNWERQVSGGLKLLLGRAGDLTLERVDLAVSVRSLLPATWLGPARRWDSVTPIVLDRYPGKLGSREPAAAAKAFAEAEATIADACGNIGLPRPAAVTVQWVSSVHGSPPAGQFPPFAGAPGRPRRMHVHAAIEFEAPVLGPVLLGRGRYLGLGLCRPLSSREPA